MRISWDDWGVPTVEGTDDNEVSFGVGHAQAVAHASEVLQLFGIARGCAAALWGEAYVDEDTFHAQLGLDDVVDQWQNEQQPSTVERIQAFCDGFNAACTENAELGTTRRAVLPITPRDVIAHTVRTMVRFAASDPQGLAFPFYLPRAASNAWAVSAKRSSTGRSMLMINPHLAWRGFHRFFEFRSSSPGRRFHGVALLGMPWQAMGFNEHAGWTHTVNPAPVLNVYALDLAGDEYRFDGEQRRLDVQEHKLEVSDGESVAVLVRRSVHGPVVTAPDGTAVAVRIAGIIDCPGTGTLEAWWQMSLASDVEQVLAAAQRCSLPFFNIIAADSAGATAAAYCATPGVHTAATYDDLAARMPGDDPAYLWDDVHPVASMPQVVDPDCGWVQNVNETPWWYCHPPLNPDAYPPAIAPAPSQLGDVRSAHSRAWLDAHDSISPDDLLSLKFSTRAILADVMLDELCAAARLEPGLEEAAEVLASWDRHAQADSPGYPLFYFWLLMNGSALVEGRIVEGESEPGGLPTRLVDPSAAITALRAAVAVFGGIGLPLNITLGQWLQMSDHAISVPADGGTAGVGVMKDFEPLPAADGSFTADYGDTWIALVEFRPDAPPIAQGLLVYGNATEPSAPKYRSQIDLFARSELRPIDPIGGPPRD